MVVFVIVVAIRGPDYYDSEKRAHADLQSSFIGPSKASGIESLSEMGIPRPFIENFEYVIFFFFRAEIDTRRHRRDGEGKMLLCITCLI